MKHIMNVMVAQAGGTPARTDRCGRHAFGAQGSWCGQHGGRRLASHSSGVWIASCNEGDGKLRKILGCWVKEVELQWELGRAAGWLAPACNGRVPLQRPNCLAHSSYAPSTCCRCFWVSASRLVWSASECWHSIRRLALVAPVPASRERAEAVASVSGSTRQLGVPRPPLLLLVAAAGLLLPCAAAPPCPTPTCALDQVGLAAFNGIRELVLACAAGLQAGSHSGRLLARRSLLLLAGSQLIRQKELQHV